MYKPVPDKPDFPALERRALEFWDQSSAFETVRRNVENSDNHFSFIDGPITADNPMGVPSRLGPHAQGSITSATKR